MEIWFWGQGYEKTRFVVLWVVFLFGSVGRNCIKKQPKGSVFGTIFIPFCTSWVPRGIWKSTKITTSWKHANPNTNKMKNRKFFECVAILLKTERPNGCTFTVVLWKRGVKKWDYIYRRKIRKYEQMCKLSSEIDLLKTTVSKRHSNYRGLRKSRVDSGTRFWSTRWSCFSTFLRADDRVENKGLVELGRW